MPGSEHAEPFTASTLAPFVIAEHVSKEYEPPRPRRVQRLFSRLGGISPGEPFFDDSGGDDDDDDDDDDELSEDSDQRPVTGSVLTDVSFSAEGGSCVAVVGPPGSGKSILLKVLAGVIPPTDGRVTVRGTIAPALDSVVGLLPKATRLDRALPVLGGMLGVSPKDVRRNLPMISDLLDIGDLKRLNTSTVPARRRRELLLATMLAVDADVVFVDMALPRGPAAERYRERVLAARDRGSLVFVTARSFKLTGGFADRVLELDGGRVVSDSEL
jgi:ABC-type polysaccharide/polyol phosphate transport system ATPase subunit